jgi:hypothetical protein
MAAAGLSVPRRERRPSGQAVGLCFDGRDGPLLAVCAACGGAGASTLACLIALTAAGESTGAVLLAEAGGPTAAISAIIGAESERGLSALASHVHATGTRPARPFATAANGLRVIARRPELEHPVAEPAVRALLEHARAAHALTVIDCGTLGSPAQQTALALASHVCWVLPASRHGIRGARALHAALGVQLPGREALCARGERHCRRGALRELAALAEERAARLLLWGAAEPGALDDLRAPSDPALRGLAGVLGR